VALAAAMLFGLAAARAQEPLEHDTGGGHSVGFEDEGVIPRLSIVDDGLLILGPQQSGPSASAVTEIAPQPAESGGTTGTPPGPSGFTAEQQRELDRRFAEYTKQHPDLPKGLQFGYANGFVLSSPEGVKLKDKDQAPFLLRINSRLQVRHTYFDSEGPNRDENDFEFERAFLIFSGYVYTPDLAYHIKLDGDSDETEGVDLLDYYVTYDFGHDVLCCDEGRLGLKVGKWKVPFHRARQEASHQFQFADRSMASEFFDINRSIGVGLFGRCDIFGQAVNWEAALFNGFQTQRFVPGRSDELNRNFGYAARIYSDVIGEWGQDGEPDLSWHELPAVRIGTAAAFTRLDRDEGLREFLVPRVVDSGAPLGAVLPVGTNEFSMLLYSADLNFKYHGFSLLSEYYARWLTDFAGTPVQDLFDHGFLLQAGYFLIPEKLELLARWSRVVGDSGTLGGARQSADEVAGGIGWYFRGQSLKLVTDVTHLNGAPVNSPSTNIRPGDDGWLVRTQFQFLF
jgi:hypothetical protein